MRLTNWILLCLLLLAPSSYAQENCKHHADLNPPYCDENKDFVADPPRNRAGYKNPDVLLFSYAVTQDPTVVEKIFQHFLQNLGKCTSKNVAYTHMPSPEAQVDAMRNGKLHIAGLNTGLTVLAVNTAGAVPFAAVGKNGKFNGYHLILVVKKDSPYRTPSALKGKKVAHVSPTSNSGHMAPFALLPKVGLTPGKDYEVIFSGRQDKSILGVQSGEYDAAPVASDVFSRMVTLNQIKEDDFRVLYKSPWFPTSSITYAHDLDPDLRERIVKCVYDFHFPPEMQKAFEGAERFVPVNYLEDWSAVRMVAAVAANLAKKTSVEKKQ